MDTPTISPYHKYVKQRLQNEPEFRQKVFKGIVDCNRKRYLNDPDFKAKHDERSRQGHKERYANDPEYRERKKEQSRIYQQKKRLLKSQQINNQCSI